MKLSPFRTASLLALVSAALSAHAADAFSNLDPAPNTYRGGQAATIGQGFFGNNTQGYQFTATSTGALSGFQTAINDFGNGAVNYTLQFYADNANTLGSLLGTYSATSSGGSYITQHTALSSVDASGTAVAIASGSKYWLVASSGSQVFWSLANSTATTPHYINGTYDATASGAFSVQVSPVPEPSAFAALGLGALAFLRRRRA